MILNWRQKFLVLLLCMCILESNVGIIKVSAEAVPTGFTVIDQSNSGEYINVKINQLINDGVKIFI